MRSDDQEGLPDRRDYPVIMTKSGQKIPIRQLLMLDQDNLDLEYEIQSPWSMVIQDLCSSLSLKVERLERRIDSMEAKKFLHYRSALATGARPPSVEVVKSHVTIDPEVEALYEELFTVKKEYESVAALKLAFACRKDMLISLGAEIRLGRKGS